jgi:hypothetical protein
MGTERDFVVKKGLVVTEDIELGHATDTTIARASAGDVNIEGNIIYRAGGTDVPVTDGGTGVSTLTNGGVLLGSGTGAITAMAVLSDGQMIVGDGTTDPVAESGATLRTSIGVGTGDTVQFTGINLGHASDTTIARASAGQITVEGTAVVLAGGANHDGFSDFVANEHIDHSGVSISSGSGLTGGGTIAATRTLTVGAGTGITVNTNDVAITAAQTGITSVLNTSLAIGRDSTDQIKFGTDNQIIFRVGNADGVTFKASGEIEATSLDISGDADIDGALIVGTGANPISAGVLTVVNDNADTYAHTLLLMDNEDDTTAGPSLALYRNTASPAINDILGKITFNGEDAGGNARGYGSIRTESTTVGNGTHDGALIFNTAIAGTQTDIFRIDTGVRAMIAGMVNITGTTTLTDEQSGSYVYVTGSGAPTLPPTAIAGQQFTLINNTGANLTVGLGTSNAIASGWTGHAVMADETARTYISPATNKWIYIG